MTTSIFPDNIYLDLINTNYQSTTTEPTALNFNETRNQTFIDNPNDYTLSIVRFQLDTFSLPSYIASIQPNQANPNLMIHSVNLSYWNGSAEITISPTYLIWKPSYTTEPVPPAPNTSSDGFQYDTRYYYGYSFQHISELINTALATALTALKVAVGAGINNADAPFIHFDELTQLFKIVAVNADYNINNSSHIRIYFNRPLFGLMSSFPAFRKSITDANNNVYQIKMDSENGINLLTKSSVISNKECIYLNQEYSTVSNFCPISSLVFTTTLLPIVSTALSAPLVYNNNQLVRDANSANNSALIITDIASNDGVSYKPNLIYNPTAEYRRISLNSNRPLNAIDIQCYWKTKRGVLKPFVLWSGGSASIKILFERKKKLIQ